MNIKIKQSVGLLISIIAISLCLSCEDTMLNNMVDDEVYLLDEGLNEVNIFNFEQPIIPIHVIKSGAGQRAIQLRLAIDPDLLTAYNEGNGTAYKLLDPAVYQLKNSSIDMESGTYDATFELAFDSERYTEETNSDPDALFAIPCTVTVLNPMENDPQEMQTIIVPKVSEPYMQFAAAGFRSDINTITPASSSHLWYYLKVELNYPNHHDVNFTVGTAKNQGQLIEQYNQEHGTGYKPFPESVYQVEENPAVPKGTDYAALSFQIFKDGLVSEGVAYGDYMLALEIDHVSANKIHPVNNYVVIPFSYHE
ncbi:DUF1735 domain-containing protein [Parapedobacter sp. 10938]|uniref:DUF1735 domain-containing protein n=1 Tax=Parapedobacter flavus TaxID=3110225 RepID=UPI002DB5A48B|nr:DUF1735 domain-containing protein [Parapedobacter sp. 10938]MEC3879462.1 DUF1735 domain-containing protein [Parapedobacter sp. 10938]